MLSGDSQEESHSRSLFCFGRIMTRNGGNSLLSRSSAWELVLIGTTSVLASAQSKEDMLVGTPKQHLC